MVNNLNDLKKKSVNFVKYENWLTAICLTKV